MQKWARWWAARYLWAIRERADVGFDDLVQAALLGICAALKTYDPAGNWAQYSSYFIRQEIRALLGIKHGRIPPALLSLDAPAGGEGGEDGEGDTFIDLLPDETAPCPQEVTEYNDLQRQVRAAVERLKNDREREVVRRCMLDGETQTAVAEDFGVSAQLIGMVWHKARNHLRADRSLRTLAEIEDRTPYYTHVGVRTFDATNTSAVEKAVLFRLEQMNRHGLTAATRA